MKSTHHLDERQGINVQLTAAVGEIFCATVLDLENTRSLFEVDHLDFEFYSNFRLKLRKIEFSLDKLE